MKLTDTDGEIGGVSNNKAELCNEVVELMQKDKKKLQMKEDSIVTR